MSTHIRTQGEHSSTQFRDGARLLPVFIVGQWKCGTTWLLNILNAHPHVVGQDEIDIIRCSCNVDQAGCYSIASTQERIERFFNLSGWSLYYDRSGWKNTNVCELFERGQTPPRLPSDLSRPQKLSDLSPEVALRLYKRIKSARAPEECMDAFLEAVCDGSKNAATVVLKAADQIFVFERLALWQPNANKIVITRDGRDAAISAYHFEKLMKENNAPWVTGQPDYDYWSLLSHWARRADKILRYAVKGELRVIRYEDLTRTFTDTVRALLDWLDLESSDEIIQEIERCSSFETKAGRPRGVEAKSEMRKGVCGEWVTELSIEDKAKAWNIAGTQLAALGYTQDGQIKQLSIPLIDEA